MIVNYLFSKGSDHLEATPGIKNRHGVILREVTPTNRDSLAQQMAPWLKERLQRLEVSYNLR